MTTDMGMPPPAEPMGPGGSGQSDNRQRNMIIGVVAGVVVLCCCCPIVGYGLYWVGTYVWNNF